MMLLKSLAIISSLGIALVVAGDTQQKDDDSHTDSNNQGAEIKDVDQKRFFGNVLSSGFKMGKKDQQNDEKELTEGLKEELKRWYFGSLLGKGFKAGKRASFDDDDDDENLGREIEEVGLDGPLDDKRWSGLGNMFGKGYFLPNGRYKRDADKRFIHYFGRGLVLGERDRRDKSVGEAISDSEESEEDHEGPYVNMDDYDGFVSGNFDPEFEAAKRYIGTNPGHRFNFGKRPYEMYDVPESGAEYAEGVPFEKRVFGHVLGHGFAFGKRNENKRRPFGYVLGRGFSFGKRSESDSIDPETEEEIAELLASQYSNDEMQKRAGLVLGRGFLLGKRGNSKRYGWLLGRGFKFGKRSEPIMPFDSSPVNGDYMFDDEGQSGEYYDKRGFGHVLGSGFAFGKRNQEPDFDSVPEKRGFGFMLGRGFRLGRR